MRTGKILGAVVGGLAVLLVAALLAVWLLVDPNDYKPGIAAAVRDATGRELVLQGDIKLAVFPWIALELGPASLGNPPGFTEQPFLSFKHAAVRARLLPLLAKRLEVGRVEVDGLDLKLLKNAEGKGNWEGFGRSDTKAPAAGPPKAGETLQGIAGIQLTNARVTYQETRIENLNVETGAFVEKGVVPVAIRFDVVRGPEHGSVEAKLDLSADLGHERWRIAALNMDGVVTLAADRSVPVNLSAPAIDIDVPARTLSTPAFALNAAGAQLSGSVQVASISDAMSMTGSVSLAPLVVREYLPRMGVTLPRTRDPRAYSLVSAASEFAYGDNALRLDKLQATLDDTHLRGQVDVVDLATHAVTFDLSVDTIDVDRYLAPAGPPGAGAAAEASRAAAKSEEAGKPEAAAKPWQANGTLAVGSAHVAPLDLSNVRVTLASADRVMHFFPLKAQIDGGRYSGDITLDSRTSTPTVSLDEHLSGVDVGKLLAAESKNVHVTGRGNVNLKATGRGAGADAIMKTLSGHFEADVTDGAVEGIDLGYELGRAEALIRHQDMPGAQNSRRTKFEAFKMSAEIANGIAATHDLIISSQVLKVTGQGSTNLPAKTMDFKLLADTLRSAGNTPIQIPVNVTGNIADPTVRPDIEALAKGELRKKLQDVLQDKLKGLFGR
jgi:AsmA protein